jgi:hypothetical protein
LGKAKGKNRCAFARTDWDFLQPFAFAFYLLPFAFRKKKMGCPATAPHAVAGEKIH